jgi:hypothetical protein
MMGRARTATKYFFYGLLIGVLFAPRAGEVTRGRVVGFVENLFKDDATA